MDYYYYACFSKYNTINTNYYEKIAAINNKV